MASKKIKLIKLTNFTEIYSLTNEKQYDIDNLTQSHLLYKQFVTWCCNGSCVALLTDFMNNPVFQELISENNYFNIRSDERVCLDLRASSGYLKEYQKLEETTQEFLFTLC